MLLKRNVHSDIIHCSLTSHLQLILPNFPSVSVWKNILETHWSLNQLHNLCNTKLAICLELLVSDFLFHPAFFLLIFQTSKVQMFSAAQESKHWTPLGIQSFTYKSPIKFDLIHLTIIDIVCLWIAFQVVIIA